METDQKDQTPEMLESPQETPQTDPQRLPRRMRRKKGFRMPLPAAPVKAIWKSASPEEQKSAHQKAILVLEHWMGRMNRKELAEKMGIPQVRVWQLAQAALSGMVSGLLKQPKNPPPGTTLLPEENPKLLKKRIEDLEHQNKLLTGLIGVLRDLPAAREALAEVEPEARKGKKNQQTRRTDQDRDLQTPPRNPQKG